MDILLNQILFRKQQRTASKNDHQDLSLITTHSVCSRSVSIWRDAHERSLYWHSGPGHHLRTASVSCSSSFLLFTLSKRAWKKSETSKGMKKMGLKFDLSVAWLVMSDKGRWWNSSRAASPLFNMTPQWKKRLPCGTETRKLGLTPPLTWLRVWPGKKDTNCPHRGPHPILAQTMSANRLFPLVEVL